MAKPRQAETEPAGRGQRLVEAVAFFRESWREIGRVRWPGRKEVTNYTVAALLVCTALALIVWGFDVVIYKLMLMIGLV